MMDILPSLIEPPGYYRTLDPKEPVQAGDEIAWHMNDLSRPESWSLVTSSVGVYPKSFPQFVWRRRIFPKVGD